MKRLPHIKQLIVISLLILTTSACTYEWDNPYDELGDNYQEQVKGEMPTASFTLSKSEIATGENIVFTDQSTGNPTSWEWDFGDGGSSTQQNPSHVYNNAGIYTVTLSVANEFGTDAKTLTNSITVNKVIETGTVTDYDGNIYKTVVIGTQSWMAENLKVTHYPNGTAITLVTDNTAWANLGDNDSDDAYCYYENNSSSEYGALYTYAAAKDACPTGWHLPSDNEWKTLEMYLGMSQSDADNTGWRGTDEGTKLKATSGWNSSGNGTDDYGFAALPGGHRYGRDDSFLAAGSLGVWWSSTEYDSKFAYFRELYYDYDGVARSYDSKSGGFSVRCLKGEPSGTAPTATFTANQTEITAGESITFTDQSTGEPTSWTWDFGDGGSSTEQNPSYTYSTAGTYTVALTVTNAYGNGTETKTDYITVNATGSAPVAAFTANQTEIKAGESITFTDQSTGEPTSWSWDFGDGGTSTEQKPSYTYSTAGTYTVALTVTNAYGNDIETKTDYITVNSAIEYGSVTDYDGNTYKIVTIGNQTWMAENLKVSHYPDGTEIPYITDNTAWANLGDNDSDDAYCYCENNSSSEYGALYTYAAAKDACPTGWHLPSDNEWKTLEMYLGMSQSDADNTGWRGTDEGTKLKATSGWNSSGNGTDDYGFAALPGGNRYYLSGSFGSASRRGYWWSSTEYGSLSAYRRVLNYDYDGVNRYISDKSYGYSVRCLRD